MYSNKQKQLCTIKRMLNIFHKSQDVTILLAIIDLDEAFIIY